jgi:sugar porter (SP) family MFS transporter
MKIPKTVADGYSRTDQRIPIATSTTPVAPPLDFDYNDGLPENNDDGDDDDNDDDDDDDNASEESDPIAAETGIYYHLPNPNHPYLQVTHEGEHRHDNTTSLSQQQQPLALLPITRSTKLWSACAAINSCNLGYDIGVNTGAGPLLQVSLNLTDLQIELFMGSLNLYAMIGALSSYYISDKLGRRWAFRVAAMSFIFGTIIQSGANGYISLMLGRAFVGLGVGFGLSIDPVYIGEISTACHRGQLVTWSEIGINVGIVLGFSSGLLFANVEVGLAWRLMFALGAVLPCVVIFVSTFIMPESPRWLVSKDRVVEAREVLQCVYPPGYDVDIIIRDIKEGLDTEAMAENSTGWDVLLFPSPAFKRMLLVGVGTTVAQQAVGIEAIQYFLVYILDGSGVKSRKTQMYILICLGILKLSVVVLAGHLFDRKGRRPLFFTSLIGMAISLLLISMGFVGNAHSAGFAVTGLALYLAFFSVGMGPGAWLIPSEVFSTLIRAKAMSVATFMNRITATLMASTFLSVANAISWAGFFIMMSLVCLIILAWMYMYLPETKGRPLEDMSRYFAEITGDRSLFEAEELLHRIDEPTIESSRRRASVAEVSRTRTPVRPTVYEKPPPEDANVIGTMA